MTCKVEGCETEEQGPHGYCNKHYKRWKRHGDPHQLGKDGTYLKDQPMRLCSVEGCDRPHRARGYCMAHYNRFKRYGNPCENLPVEYRSHGHGMLNTRTYNAWKNMKKRCRYRGHTSNPNYRLKGIKICDRWEISFDAFVNDMGEAPEGMTLDRIDNDGDYCPENCRWVDPTTQSKNKG